MRRRSAPQKPKSIKDFGRAVAAASLFVGLAAGGASAQPAPQPVPVPTPLPATPLPTHTLQITGARPNPPGPSWSPSRATGAPDAKVGADDANAWAAQQADGGAEWIELKFASPIKARAVHIYQQFNPGAVARIEALLPEGPRVLWEGNDSLRKSLWRLDLPGEVAVERLRLHLDTRRVTGWNEIDAVGLLDPADQVHWAQEAKASAYYGQPAAPTGPTSLVGQQVHVGLARGDVVGRLVKDDGQFLEIARPGQPSLFIARSAVLTIEGLEPVRDK